MIKSEKRLLFVTLNRIVLISSLHYTTYFLYCLFVYLTGLPSTMCLMPLCPFLYYYFVFIFFYFMFYFFLHVLICIFVIVAFLCTYMYVYIFDLYLSVFLRFTVSV